MPNLAITFLASFLIWVLIAALALLWASGKKIKKEQIIHAIMAMIIAWSVSTMIKSLIPTSRPFQANGRQTLTVTVPGDNAFPSSHTAIAFALATTIWLHDKRTGAYFLVGALLVGIGRILGNVHYPEDILGGVIIGYVTALMLKKIHFPLDS